MSTIITNAGNVDLSHIVQGQRTVIGGVRCQVYALMPEGLVFFADGRRGAVILEEFVVKELVARDLLFFQTPNEEPPADAILLANLAVGNASIEPETDPRYTSLRDEDCATQEQLVNLAHALGIDAEDRWDNDSCPNNSEIARDLASLAEALKTSHSHLVEALERLLEYVLDPIEYSIHDVEPMAQAALLRAKCVAEPLSAGEPVYFCSKCNRKLVCDVPYSQPVPCARCGELMVLTQEGA